MAIRGSSLMNSAPANARKRTRRVLTFFTISRQGVLRTRWKIHGERRHDEKAFDDRRDRGNIFAACRRKCAGAAWRRRDGGVGRGLGRWSDWVGRGRGGRLFGRTRNCVELGRQRTPALSPRPLSPISGAIIRRNEASHKCPAARPHWLVNAGPFRRAGSTCPKAPLHRRQWRR
jgi:hypothetical protein